MSYLQSILCVSANCPHCPAAMVNLQNKRFEAIVTYYHWLSWHHWHCHVILSLRHQLQNSGELFALFECVVETSVDSSTYWERIESVLWVVLFSMLNGQWFEFSYPISASFVFVFVIVFAYIFAPVFVYSKAGSGFESRYSRSVHLTQPRFGLLISD